MISELATTPCPAWLTTLSSSSAFPGVRQLLRDSLYYPGCDLNGTPVKYLAGNVHSFVYADYGVTEAQFLENLNGECEECGFKHYRPVVQRALALTDVIPPHWHPALSIQHEKLDCWLHVMERHGRLFAHWSVWERCPDAPVQVGPQRFSFLYIGGEISACYQWLYVYHRIAPMILAIIQPNGWDGFGHDGSFFRYVVRSNRAGMPGFLLHGGWSYAASYQTPCWSDYGGPLIARLPERHAGLWRLKP